MPTEQDVKFSDFIRGLPAATDSDLSAGKNMPIVSASDIKKMGGENVAKTMFSNLSFGHTRNVTPNVDTSAKTIDFGGDFFIRSNSGYYAAISSRSIPLVDTTITSSLQLICFDFSTKEFKNFIFNKNLSNENVAIIGMVRCLDNVNFEINKIWFPFDFTIDGFSSDEHVSLIEKSTDVRYYQHAKSRGTGSYVTFDFLKLFGKDNVSIHNLKKSKCMISVEADKERDRTFSIITSSWATILTTTIKAGEKKLVDLPEQDFDYFRVYANGDDDSDQLKVIVDYNYFGLLDISLGQVENTANEVATNLPKSGFEKKSQTLDTIELGWNQTGIAKNRVKTLFVPCLHGFSFEAKLKSNSYLNIGLHENNATGTRTYDSGWTTSASRIFSSTASTFDIWLKKVDNTNFTAAELAEISDQFEYINADVLVQDDRPAGINLVIDYYKRGIRNTLKNVRNIAHQGFSTTSRYYGDSRVSSYIGAANNGFDFGECDVQFSSDGVAVCCHDPSFVDGISGDTIVIANHTAAELKTYQYGGETIATFDEVVAVCKDVGLGLYVDKCSNFLADETKRNHIFGIVKKYAMEKRIFWTIGASDQWYNPVKTWFPDANVSFIVNPGKITDAVIAYANNAYTGLNMVDIAVNYSEMSVDEIIAVNAKLKPGVGVLPWTIDNVSIYKQYKPYVVAITSNKLSEFIVNG